jgi:hypothetical protein
MIYTDPDLNMDFDIPFFENVSQEDMQVKHRDVVFRAMEKAIVWLGDNTQHETVPCFSANGTIFEINIDGVHEHIENCIEYFQLNEDYEACGKLLALSKIL